MTKIQLAEIKAVSSTYSPYGVSYRFRLRRVAGGASSKRPKNSEVWPDERLDKRTPIKPKGFIAF